MIKTIALLSDDEQLTKLCEETDKVCDTFVQRKKFLDKQEEDLLAEGQKAVSACVDRIEEYLTAQGKMPKDFDKKKHHTHFSLEKNVVYICDGEHDRPHNIGEAIAKALGIT